MVVKSKMEKQSEAVVLIIVSFIIIATFSLFLAFPIKWCWNYTMPMIFDLQTINWGQAWCLNFLTGCFISIGKVRG